MSETVAKNAKNESEKNEKNEKKGMENVYEVKGAKGQHIEVEQETLAAMLKIVLPVVPNKATQPVQETVKLDISGTTMSVSAFNYGQNVTVKLEIANPEKVEDALCVTARKFSQIVGAMKKERIALFRDEDVLMLAQGASRFNIRINSTYGDEFNFGEDGKDDATVIKLGGAAQVGNAMGMVASCQSKEEDRKQLCGVNIGVTKNGVLLVATDGRRLATNAFACRTGVEAWDGIVPSESVGVIENLCKEFAECDTKLTCTKAEAIFAFGDKCVFKTKLVEGSFPNYKKVIKDKTEMIEVLIPREEFLAVLKQTCFVNPDLKMSFAGTTLTVDAEDEQGNHVHNEIELANVPSELDECHISFNANFVMPFLSKCEDESLDIFLDTPSSDKHITLYTIYESKAMFLGMGMKK